MEFVIIRTYYPNGTNGSLHLQPFLPQIAYTIELPWKNNEPGVSCIPEGKYNIEMRSSSKFGLHMILLGVKDRSLILIHPANNALKELRGCIAPVKKLTGEGRGSGSRLAFEKLRRFISSAGKNDPVYLTIKSINHDDQGKVGQTNTAVLSKTA